MWNPPSDPRSALGAAYFLRNHLRGERLLARKVGCPSQQGLQAALRSRELEREQENLCIRVFFVSLHCLLWSHVYFFSLLFGELCLSFFFLELCLSWERLPLNVLHQKASCVDVGSLSTPKFSRQVSTSLPPSPAQQGLLYTYVLGALGGLSFSTELHVVIHHPGPNTASHALPGFPSHSLCPCWCIFGCTGASLMCVRFF